MREAGEKNSDSIKRATGQCHDARSFAVQPQSAEERGKSQHKNADRKRQRYFRNAPTELLREWRSENAPCINGAKRDLKEHSRDCDYPAIIRAHDLIIAGLRPRHS